MQFHTSRPFYVFIFEYALWLDKTWENSNFMSVELPITLKDIIKLLMGITKATQ